MESFQAQMVDLMSRRLQQVDGNQTVLPDNIHTLNERFRSLQSQNGQLREDVVYLSAKCEALEQHCGQLYDGQSDVFRTTRDLDDQLDKLETHSRRNNVRFFSVIEDPNEDYKACVHKVVKLLNSFYPSKTWTSDDIERVHWVGPVRKNNTRPAPS